MSAAPAPASATETHIAATARRRRRWRWLRHRSLVAGAAILGALILLSLAGPLIWRADPYEQDLLSRLVPPIWMADGVADNPLGTDNLGRDFLARLLYGGRIALLIGLGASLISGVIGTALGIAAGYFGGLTDRVISFLITARLAVPVILVALAVVASIGSSLHTVIAVLGLLLWDRYALVVRTTTRQLRGADYILAAEMQGYSSLQVLWHEIMPNLLNNLVIVATLEVAQAIVLEAALSFLGLGVPPPLPSWGLMIAEGKSYILFDPWLITAPGVMLFMLVLAINLLGDGLRDAIAPGGRG